MSLRESCLRELREVRTAYYLLGERLLDLEERIASLEIGEADLPALEPALTPRSWGSARAPSSPANSASAQSYPASAVTGVGDEDIQREAAVLTGQFFRRVLDDQPFGRSGRERVNLTNNFYVVIRDYAGLLTERPVRIFDNFVDTARLVVGPGGDLGVSLFAGFHSIWEARLSVETAGLEFPAGHPLN